jgi:alpha-beta hydrolase superfamily lysophospholipase
MTLEVLLLPAVRTRAADAIAAGFADAIARHAPGARLTLVDLAPHDLADRRGVDAVIEAHLAPAIAAGRRPWLAGLSLGAWLALLRASRRPHEVTGLALLAPWLGTREMQREFAAAGGLAAWLQASGTTVPSPRPGSLDEERAAWRFLAAPAGLPVWLGYGEKDRFQDAQSLAATLLPAGRVAVIPDGRHDWRCWAEICEHFLRWVSR